MPYYRIVIWTTRKKQPYRGIRVVENPFIEDVYEMFKKKAFQVFAGELLDIEVQQLSKHSVAVIRFLSAQESRRNNNRRFGSMS